MARIEIEGGVALSGSVVVQQEQLLDLVQPIGDARGVDAAGRFVQRFTRPTQPLDDPARPVAGPVLAAAHFMASASWTSARDTSMRALLAEGVSVASAISANE